MSKKNVICFFFICIIVIKFIYIPTKYNADSKNQKYIVMIEEKYKEKEDYVSYIVKLGKETNSKVKFKDKFILNIYNKSFGKEISQKENIAKFKYGDCLKVIAKISIPEYMNNPGEFNYKNYLYSNNIYGIINTYTEVEKEDTYSLNILQKGLSKLNEYKEYMSQKLDSKMSAKYSNVIKGIIYGEKTGVEEEIKENFKDLGVSHILSVSGAHISSVILTLNLLFFKVKNKKIKGILNIVLLTIYVIISGMGISSIRAYIMMIATIIGSMQNKKMSKLKTLLLAFLIILFLTPYAIFNLGFQLSFLASLGIILLLPLFKKFWKKRLKCKNKFLKYILRYILDSIFLTLSVQIMILPIEISSLNSVSLLILLSNILFGIFTTPMQVIGSMYMLFSYVPYLDNILIYMLKYISQVIVYMSEYLSKISFNITTMSYPVIFHILYYVILFAIYILLKLKASVKELTYTIKRKWRNIKIVCFASVLMYIFSIVIYTVYSMYYSSYVYFFNVGQGEMSYIKSGSNSVIIDIGSVSTTLAGYTISNYFKSQNIKYIDTLILTHMHSDHVNGLSKLLEICQVGKVIYSAPNEKTKVYEDFLSLCKKYNLNICEGVKEDKYILGDIEIMVLSPDKNKITDKDYINTNSLICKVSVKNKNILYMADATYATEEYLLKDSYSLKDIDIIKVSHHGSKNGSKEEFIESVKPKFAVISAKKKYYNHPHEDTIETLKKYKVHILITENIGAIKFNMYNLW